MWGYRTRCSWLQAFNTLRPLANSASLGQGESESERVVKVTNTVTTWSFPDSRTPKMRDCSIRMFVGNLMSSMVPTVPEFRRVNSSFLEVDSLLICLGSSASAHSRLLPRPLRSNKTSKLHQGYKPVYFSSCRFLYLPRPQGRPMWRTRITHPSSIQGLLTHHSRPSTHSISVSTQLGPIASCT
jgi:hypothetical protein